MMIKIKRILSCVLVLLLIVASIPATSIAAINDESEPTVTAEVVQTNFTPESEEAEGRSVSDDKDNPIASVSANYVTAQTGIVVNSNGQITRAEWLHNLAVIF